jgi:hypothetical protein
MEDSKKNALPRQGNPRQTSSCEDRASHSVRRDVDLLFKSFLCGRSATQKPIHTSRSDRAPKWCQVPSSPTPHPNLKYPSHLEAENSWRSEPLQLGKLDIEIKKRCGCPRFAKLTWVFRNADVSPARDPGWEAHLGFSQLSHQSVPGGASVPVSSLFARLCG